MVLTKSELVPALQNEVRILLQLAAKLDQTWLSDVSLEPHAAIARGRRRHAVIERRVTAASAASSSRSA
jgi:hypothetical protein